MPPRLRIQNEEEATKVFLDHARRVSAIYLRHNSRPKVPSPSAQRKICDSKHSKSSTNYFQRKRASAESQTTRKSPSRPSSSRQKYDDPDLYKIFGKIQQYSSETVNELLRLQKDQRLRMRSGKLFSNQRRQSRCRERFENRVDHIQAAETRITSQGAVGRSQENLDIIDVAVLKEL